MTKISKSDAVNIQFLERVKPTMEAWGLAQHPNPISYFGKSDHGYRYDFADLRDDSDVKLAAFAILKPGPQLWIKGLRTKARYEKVSDIPIIFDTIDNVYTLTRSWSIFRPLNITFDFAKKHNEANENGAARLIDSVLSEIHKLRQYLCD